MLDTLITKADEKHAPVIQHGLLTDSITHSIPANSAPTFPKPFPLLYIPCPISLKIARAFCCVFRDCRSIGSSYANDELMSEKNAPMTKPTHTLFGR